MSWPPVGGDGRGATATLTKAQKRRAGRGGYNPSRDRGAGEQGACRRRGHRQYV